MGISNARRKRVRSFNYAVRRVAVRGAAHAEAPVPESVTIGVGFGAGR